MKRKETVSDWRDFKKSFVRVSDDVLGIYGIHQDNIFPHIEDSGAGDGFILCVTVLHASNSIQHKKTTEENTICLHSAAVC